MRWRHAAIAALLLLAFAASARADAYLDAACGIGDYLVHAARRDEHGVTWAQYEGPGPAAHGEDLHFPVSLYSGAAGTGWFLLGLHRATGAKAYLKTASAAGRRLLAVAQRTDAGGIRWAATSARGARSVPDGGGVGLYTGNAGIGLFLLHLHEATGDEAFRRGAREAFARVLAARETGDDIISGDAGIGLALLEMARVTGDDIYRKAAGDAARRLAARAETHGDTMRWAGFKPYDAGFSHGAAGIAFFLEVAGEPSVRRAARFVASAATPSGDDGGLIWRYYAGDPPAGKRQWTMNSWCHGAPGTVRLFALLHARTGEKAHADLAAAGGEGVCREAAMDHGAPRFFNPTYCCGAAGCIDALCDVHAADGGARWVRDARAFADVMIRDFATVGGKKVYAFHGDDDRARANPYVPTSFMSGNAGVGYALLRLSLHAAGEEDRLLPLPDQPLAWRTARK